MAPVVSGGPRWVSKNIPVVPGGPWPPLKAGLGTKEWEKTKEPPV